MEKLFVYKITFSVFVIFFPLACPFLFFFWCIKNKVQEDLQGHDCMSDIAQGKNK